MVKKLERQLTLPAVVFISMSAMLGSGIFVLPGLAAAKTGASVWLAYLAASLIVLPATFSKIELSTAMPTSGGTYIYVDRTFGPLLGTITGLGLWLSLLLKSSFALVGFGAYLLAMGDWPIKPVAIAMLGIIVILNILGVRKVGRVQTIVASTSLVGLALLTLAGTEHFETARLMPLFTHGAGGFFATVAFVFVSYAGLTQIAAVAEEIDNPGRNLPLAILLSLSVVTLLYVALTLVLVGAVPAISLHGDLRPVYTLAEQVGGLPLGLAASVLGVLTLTSMANTGVLSASRFPFAMSREDLLPPPLRVLHKHYLTPVLSILLTGGVILFVVLLLNVEKIVKLASAFVILTYIAENISVIVLRESNAAWYKPTYRSPFYPGFQIFGIGSGIVLLFAMGDMALWAFLVVVLPGALLYGLYGRWHTKRRGIIGVRGPRRDILQASDPPVSRLVTAKLEGDAIVTVALFGTERSPETLVELGGALSDGGRVEVVALTEVPEQTALEAMGEEDPILRSIRRRVDAVGEARHLSLTFDALVSRDLARTAHDITRRLHCRWLVMEWRGRQRGTFTFDNPLGWLRDHIPCNLASFHDAGVRYIRKVLVAVEPGPHDALVVDTADHLAAIYGAELTFVRFVPDGVPVTRVHSEADYLDEIRQLASAQSKTLLARGASTTRALAQASASYDLLVTAMKPERTVTHMLRGSGADRLTDLAACSVLRLQTPRGSTHESLKRQTKAAAPSIDPAAFINTRCVELGLSGVSKEVLFDTIAQTFAAALKKVSVDQVSDALWTREKTQNTSVGHGLALPHATLTDVGRTYLGVFTTSEPVDYKAPDGRGVDVFLVTLGTPGERQTHLHLLSMISRMVIETDLLERLRACASKAEIDQLFLDCSARLRR